MCDMLVHMYPDDLLPQSSVLSRRAHRRLRQRLLRLRECRCTPPLQQTHFSENSDRRFTAYRRTDSSDHGYEYLHFATKL